MKDEEVGTIIPDWRRTIASSVKRDLAMNTITAVCDGVKHWMEANMPEDTKAAFQFSFQPEDGGSARPHILYFAQHAHDGFVFDVDKLMQLRDLLSTLGLLFSETIVVSFVNKIHERPGLTVIRL